MESWPKLVAHAAALGVLAGLGWMLWLDWRNRENPTRPTREDLDSDPDRVDLSPEFRKRIRYMYRREHWPDLKWGMGFVLGCLVLVLLLADCHQHHIHLGGAKATLQRVTQCGVESLSVTCGSKLP